MDPKTHLVITVSNIRNFILIQLEAGTQQYVSWSKLFRNHCQAYDVIDHLSHRIKPTTATQAASKAKQESDEAIWSRLDAIVLQWIYGTISTKRLSANLKKNTTAVDAWKTFENNFNNYKHTWALHLEKRFTNCRLDDFFNVSAYCNELKQLADQLENVKAPVTNDRLVLLLIYGLREAYDAIASHLQQLEPLPYFHIARSKLVLDETRKAGHAFKSDVAAATALTAATQSVGFSSLQS